MCWGGGRVGVGVACCSVGVGQETPPSLSDRGPISRQTVRNILRGETWIDLPTLYRIEQNLNVTLWTRDHWPPPEPR